MPQYTSDDKSTLVQVMEAPSHYPHTWANVDTDQYHHMQLLGHNEFNKVRKLLDEH